MEAISGACGELLAENPNLRFDRPVAYEVCKERCFLPCVQTLETLPDEATLRDFLETFPYEHSALEFLSLYIKAINSGS